MPRLPSLLFFIVDRPTLPIYIGISKTNTKDIAGQFARIHQWKQTGLPQHWKLWALHFSGWHISFSVMQKAASMASVLVLIFSPAVLVTFQGLIGNFAVFCHKFEYLLNLRLLQQWPFIGLLPCKFFAHRSKIQGPEKVSSF